MEDYLNWNSFKEEYHLKDDRYIKDIALLRHLQNDTCYPIIIYPQSLRKQISKTFMIGSVGILNDQKHIYLHDFLDIAKFLNLKGDNWQFLIHPQDPKLPLMPKIPTEEVEFYQTHNWGCLITLLIVAILFTLPAFFISPEDPGLGIIVGILWIPFILLGVYKMNIGKAEKKTRTRKLTTQEIKLLEDKAKQQYQKDIIAYQKLREDYDTKEFEFRQRLNSQAALLDKYAKLIVPTIFKRCLRNTIKIDDSLMPPQRGMYENKLFYALMQEFPSYIKVDKSFGGYFPDLVLHNESLCPIDIEVDEPYEYRTKKEIHYIGCGDEERNHFFASNNWFVLRFTENQVKTHLSECVDIIKSLVCFIESGDTAQLHEIEKTIIAIQEPRWSKEKARMLAIEQYRERQ